MAGSGDSAPTRARSLVRWRRTRDDSGCERLSQTNPFCHSERSEESGKEIRPGVMGGVFCIAATTSTRGQLIFAKTMNLQLAELGTDPSALTAFASLGSVPEFRRAHPQMTSRPLRAVLVTLRSRGVAGSGPCHNKVARGLCMAASARNAGFTLGVECGIRV